MFSYFNLFRRRSAMVQNAPTMPPLWRQAIIYVSVVFGIVALPLIKDAGLALHDAVSWRNVIVGLVVGLSIFPSAYRAAFDQNGPLLSQAGVAVMTGFGWENLIHAATKAAS